MKRITEAQRAAGRESCNAAGLTHDEATVPGRQPPDAKTPRTLMTADEVAGNLETTLKRHGKQLHPEHRKAFTDLLGDILAGKEPDADEEEADDEGEPEGLDVEVANAANDAIVRAAVADAMRRYSGQEAPRAQDSAPRTGHVDIGAVFPGGLPIVATSDNRMGSTRTPVRASDSAPQPMRPVSSAGQVARDALPMLGRFQVMDPARPTAARSAPRANDSSQRAMRRELARARGR